MIPETDRPACSEYEARLEDYLSGQLSGSDAAQVTAHLKTCRSCTAALDDARASARLLVFAQPACQPDPGFARIVMARIRTDLEASRARGFWQPFVFLAWRFAATAALGLVLMVTYGVVAAHQRLLHANTSSVQSAEVRDLFTSEADRLPANRDDVLIMVAEDSHGNR